MAEEFQAGTCGGTWWMNSSKGVFGGCSSPIADVGLGSFGWGADVVDIKSRSACEDSNIASVSDNSMVFQNCQKPDSNSGGGGGSGSGSGSDILIDSTLPMMVFGLSSTTTTTTSDWNPSLLQGNGRAENYSSMIQGDINPRMTCQQETVMDSSQIQKEWSPGDNCSTTDFLLDQQRLNPVTSSGKSPVGFPVSWALLQSLFVPDDHPQPQQQLFNNQSMNYYMSANELSPSWPKLQPPMLKPSVPKQVVATGGLHFSNNTPFWNASTTNPTGTDARTNFLSPSQSQFLVPTFEEKPSCPTLTTKTDEVRESAVMVMKKGSSEPAFKRPRLETPSPLPTFKVRKEKLGDRITALQQLVSPFGKTDTASVLHEAIEYIKFLHDQVGVLSTPYMKQGSPIQHQQSTEKSKDLKGSQQDLRSRGLCLVPISSTFPVTNETAADFWTPTFGGTFR